MTTSPLLHLRLTSGPLVLDFQGGREQVEHVAAALAASRGVTVTVDDQITPNMPKLPYARLWDEHGRVCLDSGCDDEISCAAAASEITDECLQFLHSVCPNNKGSGDDLPLVLGNPTCRGPWIPPVEAGRFRSCEQYPYQ